MALPIVIGLIVLDAVVSIAMKRAPLTGTPSRYALYIASLAEGGSVPDHPWIRYILETIGIGTILAAVGFGLATLLFF